MATYIPGMISDKAFDQAKRDARAAHSPKGVVLGSGFLAGFFDAWIPGLIVIPLLFLYRYAFGVKPWMTGEEKAAAAVEDFLLNASSYARIAIWVGLALGLYGILQAYLRQRSCLTNRYFTMELARYGELRIGREGQITIIGFPILTILVLWFSDQVAALFVALVLIVLSGFFYHLLWTALDNRFLRLLHRLRYEEELALGLRVMIPRHVGWNVCTIDTVEVNQAEKSLRVEGIFDSEYGEREARDVIEHFMRGYSPIYIINKRKQQE